MEIKDLIIRFRNKIENSKNPIMFYDCDCDGLSSFLILKRKWSKIKGYGFRKDEKNQMKLLSKIKSDCDLIIFFDIPFIFESFLNEIRTIKILWQDHHITKNLDLVKNYNNITYLNPTLFDKEVNTPSTQTAYEVSNTETNLDYCMFGSLCDFFLLENLIEFEKKDKVLFDKIFNISKLKKNQIFNFIKNHNPYDLKFQEKRSKYIQFLIYKTNFYKLRNFFDFMFKLHHEDINRAIKKISQMSLSEIYFSIENQKETFPFNKYFELEKEFFSIYEKVTKKINKKYFLPFVKKSKILCISYSSKISFTKVLIETIANSYKNFEVYVISHIDEEKNDTKTSFRSNGKVDVSTLLELSIKGLNGRGGGHKYACACNISLDDYNRFIENIKNNLDIMIK